MISKYLPMFPEAWDDGSGTSCTKATWNVSNHDEAGGVSGRGGGRGDPSLPSCADETNSVEDETSSADAEADAEACRLCAPRPRASFSRLNRHVPSSSVQTGCPTKKRSSTASSNFRWQSARLGRSRPAKNSAEYPNSAPYSSCSGASATCASTS